MNCNDCINRKSWRSQHHSGIKTDHQEIGEASMTNQNKIAYLKQYKYLNQHIDNLLEEKERWKAKAEKVTSTITGMPHGSDGENQRELAICRMIDCEKKATGMIDELCCLRKKVKIYISETGDQDTRLIEILQIDDK